MQPLRLQSIIKVCLLVCRVPCAGWDEHDMISGIFLYRPFIISTGVNEYRHYAVLIFVGIDCVVYEPATTEKARRTLREGEMRADPRQRAVGVGGAVQRAFARVRLQ